MHCRSELEKNRTATFSPPKWQRRSRSGKKPWPYAVKATPPKTDPDVGCNRKTRGFSTTRKSKDVDQHEALLEILKLYSPTVSVAGTRQLTVSWRNHWQEIYEKFKTTVGASK